MSRINVKDTTIRIIDGKRPTNVFDSSPANSDVTVADNRDHVGEGHSDIKVKFTDPGGNDEVLTFVITDDVELDIQLATDGAGAITTTATQLKTGLEADAPATALISATVEGDGAGIVEAQSEITLTANYNKITVLMGPGNLTYSERDSFTYEAEAGLIASGYVIPNDEEPMEVRIDAVWEQLKADSGATVQIRDALTQSGEAAAWVTTGADGCEPYAVDIEIEHVPPCTTQPKEYTLFPEFRANDKAGDVRGATFQVTGQCKAAEPIITKVAQS